MALVGWWTGLPLLSAWDLRTPVRPPAALALAVLGLALLYPGRDRRVAFAAGLAVAAAAVLRLSAILLSVEWGNPGVPAAGPEPGAAFQIPHATLFVLALAGGALALSRSERRRLAATVLAGLAGVIAVLALLGYLTGVNMLYGHELLSVPPPPTAVALLCVACGIILQTGRMPAQNTPQPLWRLLLGAGCMAAAPLLLFGAYAGIRVADAQFDQARKHLLNEVRAIAADIDRMTAAEIEKLQGLAVSPSLRQGDLAAFQRQAEAELAGPRRGLIFLVTPTMEQIVNTWVPYGTPLPKAHFAGPVARAFATGKPQYTGLFTGPIAGPLLFGLLIPVAIDGQYRYALGIAPDQKTFAGLVAALELPSGWEAAVTDDEYRILARSGQGGGIGTTLPQAQWFQQEGSLGIFAFTGADGRPALQANARSELTEWKTAVWVPDAVLAAPGRVLWRTLGLLVLLAFALVTALTLWLGRLIADSVGHASGAAEALGAGAPLPPGETPIAEVNRLMAQLHEAAAHREAVENRLRRSEDTFRAMFDKSSVGKIEVVPSVGRFLRANPAMCRFVGYSEEELLDMTVWDITHPEERARDREPIERLLKGEASEFDVEKRYIRKDGTPVWAHTTVNLVRDETGYPVRDFAVIQDIDARKHAEQALQASKDRLELALDAARLGSWQYDPLRGILTGDVRAKEIIAVDAARDEVPIDEILSRLHPDDVGRVMESLAKALDPADPKRAVTQFRLRQRRGEMRWIETVGQAYFEGTGAGRHAVLAVGTCQDITERKEREEKEHLLMREVNHRAKNMLSVVHAIAHQTAARGPGDFVERFSERIQALSANQDLLVRNEWNGIQIEDLVRAQLGHFAGLVGTRIAVRGPPLRLRAASAQAVGLALHELATNAGKYGALSTDRGSVDVVWGTRSRAGGDTFTMSWTESGGPPVSAPGRHGFGTTVMGAMAERSVNGKVDLDYAPSGVTWRLTCPAANALESGAPESSASESGDRDSGD